MRYSMHLVKAFKCDCKHREHSICVTACHKVCSKCRFVSRRISALVLKK
jgi:hypothetical protein